MLNKLNEIDWEKYSRQGLDSPDFVSLIQDLLSEDRLTRLRAMSELDEQLEWAYRQGRNELHDDIIPIFIELLQSEKLPDKGVVTNLLLELLSYSEIKTLKEPYKSQALRLKRCVCLGVETYKSLLADEEIREDIVDLLKSCE
ncbi:MAG: hypothetical protein KC708_25485 [Anaerolineae bacterium]|nr:hypothetical protein [Anaerolineae bacterium]